MVYDTVLVSHNHLQRVVSCGGQRVMQVLRCYIKAIAAAGAQRAIHGDSCICLLNIGTWTHVTSLRESSFLHNRGEPLDFLPEGSQFLPAPTPPPLIISN